jgi:RNA polymerase sigma-70 factor (ECF subfamily)
MASQPPLTPGPDELDDRPLVERARKRDAAAFEELVCRHQSRIYGLCYHLTGNHEDANDLAQDSFIKAWKALPGFRGDASFVTWIYRIATNNCLTHLKQRRNSLPHLSLNDLDANAENDPTLVELVSHHTPRRDSHLSELQKRLNEALLKLSEEHRMVVTMHDVQGMSHVEIAEVLGCNPGTVRSRLFYARQQLQAWLSDLIK